MRLVAFQRKVLVAKSKQVLDRRVQVEPGEGIRRAAQLLPRLVEMVQVQVRIAERMDKVARLQVRHLRDHQRKQRIRSDVERHAKEEVRAALVELAG